MEDNKKPDINLNKIEDNNKIENDETEKKNSFSLARERLNKLKKDKNEKIKKLNLFEFVNNNENNNDKNNV